MQNQILDIAIKYASTGLAVFPCHSIRSGKCSCGADNCDKPGKHPRTPRGFKDATTNESAIHSYWTQYPDANIGCATGEVSGIVVLDIDVKHGRSGSEFKIPPTPTVKTGGGGNHYFFKYPGHAVKSTNSQVFGPGVDIKADGGYVIMAPSLHMSGNHYEWVIGLEDEGLADMPEWFTSAINSYTKEKDTKRLWKKDPAEVAQGTRNETATSVAGKIRKSLPIEIRESVGWPGLLAWNNSLSKPLRETELRSVWESIKKYDTDETQSNVKLSQANALLEVIINRKDVTLFHDEQGNGYISLDIAGHQEVWACKSKALRKWISSEIWRIQKKAPGLEVVKSVLAVLEGNACYGGSEYKLNNRMAWLNGDLWYDLTNKDWQSIKINKNGWQIIDKTPIIFSRHSHHKAQLLPTENGDINLFLKYINVTNKDHQLLLKIFLVTCFIPDFPHTLFLVFGSQGSAKSTLSRLLRLVIDPSIIDVASMPESQKELIQALAHHAFLFFDNVSHISEASSDILCKAITGGGFVKRELYSDDDDIIYSFKRCIGINAINLVATRPDLLERSLLVELERVESKKRKAEKEIIGEFTKELPSILGGVFDVLVKAISIYPSIKVDGLPRMADFALWGCAIAEALGYTKEEFLSAYQENINRQTEMLINENVVANAIITFMEDKTEWKGTPTNLMEQLYQHAGFVNIDTREKYWPKGANALSRRLNELSTPLKQMGLSVVISTSGTERSIHIKKLPKDVPPTQANLDKIK